MVVFVGEFKSVHGTDGMGVPPESCFEAHLDGSLHAPIDGTKKEDVDVF